MRISNWVVHDMGLRCVCVLLFGLIYSPAWWVYIVLWIIFGLFVTIGYKIASLDTQYIIKKHIKTTFTPEMQAELQDECRKEYHKYVDTKKGDNDSDSDK